MSSEYDVTIFQPTGTKCVCLPNCESCSCFNNNIDEGTVAYNLLARMPETGEGNRVQLRPFIPWFGSSSLVLLVFKDKPPKISESSLQAISEKCDVTQDSSNGVSLLEFCPVYQRGNCYGGIKESCGRGKVTTTVAVSSAVQTDRSSARHSTDSQDSSPSSVTHQHESVWCACPNLQHRPAKAKEMKLWSFKEINLEELRILHKISYWQRGKWIIREMRNANTARFLTIEELWTKVCCFIKMGYLPHCNARYKKTKLEVWLYCDFIHSLKVRSILENGLGNIGIFPYCIHPRGVIMTL